MHRLRRAELAREECIERSQLFDDGWPADASTVTDQGMAWKTISRRS